MEVRACLSRLPVPGGLDFFASDPAAFAGGRDSYGVPFSFPSLCLPGCVLELLVCGVGPIASALALGRYLGRERAVPSKAPLRGILNLGIAGSYDAIRAPLGSLVLATEELYPEYGVWPHHENGHPPVPLPLSFPQTEIAGKKVFNRLALEPHMTLGNLGLTCHSEWRRGASITVAGVSGTPERAVRTAALGSGFTDDAGPALTENMEGFSLALGAAVEGLHFVELRAASNEAGTRPPRGWDMPAALTALGQGTRQLLEPFL